MKTFSKLRQLLEKSTPGEWKYISNIYRPKPYLGMESNENEIDNSSIETDKEVIHSNGYDGCFVGPEDSAFIAEAHNQLPRVLEALDVAMQALVDVDSCELGVRNLVNEIARKTLAKIKELAGE